jgi:hypothetical protein
MGYTEYHHSYCEECIKQQQKEEEDARRNKERKRLWY